MNSASVKPVLSPEQFRKTCARYATGVTVTTVQGIDGMPQGLTVNSFTSVSLDPPLVLVCIDRNAISHPHFEAASGFAINMLREDQIDVSQHFATFVGDRFEAIAWRPGLHGAPLLESALASLECTCRETIDGGDHTIFVGFVERAEFHDGAPLLYYASAYRRLG
jgi:flavin reductase (DIM6/NTAB) family NADH-FMN oxidoreductase RutF